MNGKHGNFLDVRVKDLFIFFVPIFFIQVDLESSILFVLVRISTFQPTFDKIFCFYQHYQPFNRQIQRKILKIIQGVDFELFDDSCLEVSK